MKPSFFAACVVPLILLTLTGCASHGVWVTAAVDPSLAPSKTEPVFVTLPERPTIDERQMLVMLKDEMCRNDFNVVENVDNSTWVMIVSATQYTYMSGTTGRTVAVPIGNVAAVGRTDTQVNYQTDKVTYLYVSKTADRTELEPRRYWEGRVTAKDNVWRAYREVIYKPLLDQYGRDYDRLTKMSKSYLKNAHGCEVDQGKSLLHPFGG